MHDGDRLLTLYRTNRPLEADAICSFLVSQGVPTMARWTAMPAGIQEFYAVDQSRAEVCVYKADLDHAMAVLSRHRDEIEQILGSSIPEPGISMFSTKRLGSAGVGLTEGLRALPLLLLAPFFLFGIFTDWVKSEIKRLVKTNGSTRKEQGR